jgi:hypothetical protein
MTDVEHVLRQVTGVSRGGFGGSPDSSMTGANTAYGKMIKKAILPVAKTIEDKVHSVVSAANTAQPA